MTLNKLNTSILNLYEQKSLLPRHADAAAKAIGISINRKLLERERLLKKDPMQGVMGRYHIWQSAMVLLTMLTLAYLYYNSRK